MLVVIDSSLNATSCDESGLAKQVPVALGALWRSAVTCFENLDREVVDGDSAEVGAGRWHLDFQ